VRPNRAALGISISSAVGGAAARVAVAVVVREAVAVAVDRVVVATNAMSPAWSRPS
jgi:hypothetical protein